MNLHHVDRAGPHPAPGKAPDDHGDADAMRHVERHQIGAVVTQLPLGAVAVQLLIGLVIVCLGDRLLTPLVLATLGAVLLLSLVSIGWWWRWRRLSRAKELPRGEATRLTVHIAVGGVCDTALFILTLDLAGPDYHLPMVATWAAVMAMGGWMLSPLRGTGLAWSLSTCIVTAGGLYLTQWPESQALIVLLLLYSLALTAAVSTNARLMRKRLEAEHHVSRQGQVIGLLLRDFEANASDWLWETDVDGRLTHVSQRLARLLGREPAQLLGQPLAQLIDPAPIPASGRPLQAAFSKGQAFRDVVVHTTLEGRERWWSLSARPLLDERGELQGWRGVGTDVTSLHERERELTHLANIDSLTGLANRHRFGQHLDAHFGTPARPCALLMLDLDNFKMVNDALGHATGDRMLQVLAERLQRHASDDLLVARLGGDEFALVRSGRHEPAALRAWASSLRKGIGEMVEIDGHRLEIRASIGIARAPEDAGSAEQLLRRSDLALYAAKAAGRNTVSFFEPLLEATASGRLELLADLRTALRQGQFFLQYQPQLCLRTGAVVGFEALVRWRHPLRGLVPPAEFIPLAEDAGLIVPLGQWVMRQACREAAAWPGALRIAVNVSATELDQSDLRASVLGALRDSGLPPAQLELEITESTLLQDVQRGTELLERFRSDGIRIALDDFGTGFSSLAYLQTFPLDKLKIDRSFVRTLSEGPDGRSAAIVASIGQLARALGLEVTAEGVELDDQHEALQRMGSEYGQGYLYARPMDAAAVPGYLQAQRAAAPGPVPIAAPAAVSGGPSARAAAAPMAPARQRPPPVDARRLAVMQDRLPDSRWVDL